MSNSLHVLRSIKDTHIVLKQYKIVFVFFVIDTLKEYIALIVMQATFDDILRKHTSPSPEVL